MISLSFTETSPLDPTEQNCANCYYARPAARVGRSDYTCHFSAPKLSYGDVINTLTRWPRVIAADWCGEWSYQPRSLENSNG